MSRQLRVGLDEVVARFEELEDPRSEVNRKHPLSSVVVIALMAVLAGAGGPTAIAQWAALKKALLTRWLPLPHGVPGKDVFRRVLMTMQPEVFQQCLVEWLKSLQAAAAEAAGIQQPVLTIDGNQVRTPTDEGGCSRGRGSEHGAATTGRTAWARCTR